MKELLAALRGSTVYDLSQSFEPSTPVAPSNIPFRMGLFARHGDVVRDAGVSSAVELITVGTHTGTHIDALAHVSQNGKLFGGIEVAAAMSGGRFARLGVETMRPIIGRGVLLDLPSIAGSASISPDAPVRRDQVKAACDTIGVELEGGDTVLIRTGWMATHYHDAEAYYGAATGTPGPDVGAVEWLADQGVRALGSDTLAFEWIEPGSRHQRLPAHAFLLVDRGLHILEVLNLEELASQKISTFVFVCVPLKLTGASGSPVRPLAIVA